MRSWRLPQPRGKESPQGEVLGWTSYSPAPRGWLGVTEWFAWKGPLKIIWLQSPRNGPGHLSLRIFYSHFSLTARSLTQPWFFSRIPCLIASTWELRALAPYEKRPPGAAGSTCTAPGQPWLQ